VELNRAVALAMVEGAKAGLAALAVLDEPLKGSHRLAAVRGHLYEMAGNRAAAIGAYLTAANGTSNNGEREFLLAQVDRLGG
jgi:predicted RNA polymerase sigma factor